MYFNVCYHVSVLIVWDRVYRYNFHIYEQTHRDMFRVFRHILYTDYYYKSITAHFGTIPNCCLCDLIRISLIFELQHNSMDFETIGADSSNDEHIIKSDAASEDNPIDCVSDDENISECRISVASMFS